MKILSYSLALFLLTLALSCTQLEDYDCQGRTDFPTTSLVDNETAADISALICNSINEEDIPAIQITIVDSLGTAWNLTTGSTDKKRTIPATDDHVFRLASVTKPFVAALTFKLIEEGYFTLDTKVAEYFPESSAIENVTIAHLLDHSSGIKDLLTLPDVLLTSTSNTTKVWDPNRIAEVVLNDALQFDPGTDHRYSNSNYLLLGLIANEVTGEELHLLLREYLFEPLGLSGFTFHPVENSPENLVHGYDKKLIPKPGFYELTPENTSFSSAAYASGNLMATSETTALFFHHLFDGQLLTDTSLDQMATFSTGANPRNEFLSEFGSGLFQYTLNGEVYVGHEGQFIGFDNIMVYHPLKRITIVMLANLSTYEKFDLLNEILLKL
jgi:D-alanyl-D-alanine carboxypeptidase